MGRSAIFGAVLLAAALGAGAARAEGKRVM